MAIGTSHRELTTLLVLEALIIGLLGTLCGLMLGFVIVLLTGITGIDLSILLGDTSRFYVDPLVHPRLNLQHLGITVAAILVTSVLAGLYPAWRATTLQPAEAIRHG
jgi:ABC-type lipoprotein release transport system permease subunit